MSDKKIFIGDTVIGAQLKEKSSKLNISLEGLVDRYIRRGLFMDDYYKPPKLTAEELMEISRKNVEEDRKRGILPKKHNFDVFIGRWNKSEE